MSDLIFDADSADKAARTLEFLESFRSHPDANGKVCLHGGTALNLFVLTPERLRLTQISTTSANARLMRWLR